MVKENIFGLMEIVMKEIISKIKLMDLAPTNGQTVKFILESGLRIKCMEKVRSFGLMAINMKVIIKRIRRKVMEFSSMQMGKHTKEHGIMGNNMEKEF